MSNKKKTKHKKRTYTEGEVRRLLMETCDKAVAKTILLCVTAAKDECNLDKDGVMKLVKRMDRYVGSEEAKLIKSGDASDSLLKDTGIDLRLSRW